MGHQPYVVRYYNKKLYRAPVTDNKTGRLRGGYDGWCECYVYGQKVAKMKAAELATIHGANNVSYEAFTDPVKNPYKRRKEKKTFRRQENEEVNFFGEE